MMKSEERSATHATFSIERLYKSSPVDRVGTRANARLTFASAVTIDSPVNGSKTEL